MILTTKKVVMSAIVIGIITGLLWFIIGEFLVDILFGDTTIGNFVSFYLIPFVIAIILAIIIFNINEDQDYQNKIKKSLIFGVVYYIFHIAPILLFLLFIFISGPG